MKRNASIEIQGRFIDLHLRKALALLAYLATTDKAHTRDTLAAMFWPEADQQTSGRLCAELSTT